MNQTSGKKKIFMLNRYENIPIREVFWLFFYMLSLEITDKTECLTVEDPLQIKDEMTNNKRSK